MAKLVCELRKVYVDTNHLINIADIRGGKHGVSKHDCYLMIDKYICSPFFAVIFSPFAALEWVKGKSTPQRAKQIADVVASANLTYELSIDKFVFTSEVLGECQKLDSTITVPEIPILQPVTLGSTVKQPLYILANLVPGYLTKESLPPYMNELPQECPEELPINSVLDYLGVALGYNSRNPGMYSTAIKGDAESFAKDKDAYEDREKLDKAKWLKWIKGYLRIDEILTAKNPGIDAESLLEQVDIKNCPGTRLWLTTRMKRIQAKCDSKEGDVQDLQFVPVVPYADLVLTERNLKSFMLQADRTLHSKVFHDPCEAADVMKSWTEIT